MWLSLFLACVVQPDGTLLPSGASKTGVTRTVSVKESGTFPTESSPGDSVVDPVPTESTLDSPADTGGCDSGYKESCEGERVGSTAAERAGELGGAACGGDKAGVLIALCLGAGMLAGRGPRGAAS